MFRLHLVRERYWHSVHAEYFGGRANRHGGVGRHWQRMLDEVETTSLADVVMGFLSTSVCGLPSGSDKVKEISDK